MEKCFDIKGNEIITVALADDGIVYGLLDNNTPTYTLSAECCTNLGYEFDPEEAICYWSKIKSNDDVNVIINSDSNTGGLFIIPENSSCGLNISFDYLFSFRCKTKTKCELTYDQLINMKISYILQAIDDDGNIENIDNVSLIDFSNTNLFSLENTGLFFETNNSRLCGYKFNNIYNEFLNNGYPVNASTFNSSWVNFNTFYESENLIEYINNKKLRIGFNVENLPCGLSIKVDNININSKCLQNSMTKSVVLKNPSFLIEKVIDNKKTWLNDDIERIHDLKYRETNYSANDDQLILNSKEIDLHFSTDNGIEHDLWVFIKNNSSLLDENIIDGVNINELLDFDWSNINNLNEFINLLNTRLIDVKSIKTINSYSTLKLIYYRYVNSFLYVGVQSNAFTYNDMLNYINILDNYWLELIEQFIPSTTIWGATIKIGNSVFDSEKFVYKKYNMSKVYVPQTSCKNSVIINGALDTNFDGWDVQGQWSIIDGMAAYAYQVIGSDVPDPITQYVLTPGKKYRISLDVDLSFNEKLLGKPNHFVNVYAGPIGNNTSGIQYVIKNSGHHEFELTATGNEFNITVYDVDYPCDINLVNCQPPVRVGNVCVYEITDNNSVETSGTVDLLTFTNINAIQTDLISGETETFNQIGIYQINDGSEFYGSVTIIKPGENKVNGNSIVLSESKNSTNQSL